MSRIAIIAIPHQLPPAIWHVLPQSIARWEEDARDEHGERLDDEGLHDLHAWVRIEEATMYRGHRQDQVRRLAAAPA